MSEMSGAPTAWEMLESDEEIGHLLKENHRLAYGVQAVPHKDGVALLGGPVPEMYSGYGLRKVLSQVLPLLDGEHTMEEIDARCPELEPRQIRTIVGNLFMNGLLRTGPASELRSDMEQYLDRMVGTTGVHRSGKAATESLRNARLGLFAPPQVAQRLTALFAEMEGGAAIRIVQPEDLDPALDLLLVVAVPGGADPGAVFARANRLGIPALNMEIAGRSARTGPLVVPQVSASYACYLAAHERLTDTPAQPDAYATMFWSASALHMAMGILARTIRRPLINAFVDNSWRGGRQVERRSSIARLHSWEAGGNATPLPLTAGQPGYEGWKQYCSIALQTQEWNPANSYLIHFKPENIQSIFERVPAIFSGTRIPLPKQRPQDIQAGKGLTLESLGVLTTHMAGYHLRDGVPHRVVPTGGGLGSTLLMILVRDVAGLEPGSYWFDSSASQLERMKDIDLPAMYDWLQVDRDAPAVMLSFANVGKVARKYGPFSINISWYDSGVMLAYARNISAALGLRLTDRARPAEPEAMMERLGLPSSALLPTGVLELSGGPRLALNAPAPKLEELFARITQRRATRSWAPELNARQLDNFCVLAEHALARHREVSGLALDISLLLLMKQPGGQDGFYEYRHGQGLRAIASYPREQHGDILSQGRLTEAPVIVFPQIHLGRALAAVGDEGVETAYRAAGTIVGDLWVNGALAGLVGTACGGAFEGRIRAVTGRHGLEHFAPLALCLGAPDPREVAPAAGMAS